MFKNLDYKKFVPLLILIILFCTMISMTKRKWVGNNENLKFSKRTYIDEINNVRNICGDLCNTSRVGHPGIFFDRITANINCKALFSNAYVDSTHGFHQAPRNIPSVFQEDFTMGGKIRVHKSYFNQPYLGNDARTPVWTKSLINKYLLQARQGKLFGAYGISETNALRDGLRHAPGVKNGRILVIGSERPWVEACLLEAGAYNIVTLEYGKIHSEHDNITTIVPSEYRRQYLDNTLGLFDVVVSFSSIEHSGLGRYGDVLNPWGDLIVVARAWCVTKSNGSLVLGVLYDINHDFIAFNAHRCYGRKRYPYLTTNWNQHYLGKGKQRVHVFTK
ncbi:uncharacterized protein LOC127709189 [Mytilus californianus]|uniref:uncharacterized protein LOC127709189 n=1 Tax=Mytilus californianus TaxID=6549 RepID=UPI0022462610|nr:uncharacterized protein LOC127709189 [Mytilus californianus]XP_052070559.1 uncharacterized protein LOC127709189 [Mytilus californianus]XP_052070564.1 uncharacterized protein LOC127709189 [Mytilus californianus]XP_052070569.1 uncharacterized protein LOC127709189 [Mytilus californianus]XP_052070578.1 uncharacterized protein LOC127709189 [Mytilus californianus]XP_052070585.1 uncharacterized protein LOC127709189 [Mytilus californianus]